MVMSQQHSDVQCSPLSRPSTRLWHHLLARLLIHIIVPRIPGVPSRADARGVARVDQLPAGFR